MQELDLAKESMIYFASPEKRDLEYRALPDLLSMLVYDLFYLYCKCRFIYAC